MVFFYVSLQIVSCYCTVMLVNVQTLIPLERLTSQGKAANISFANNVSYGAD
jgi:hypothetical protein